MCSRSRSTSFTSVLPETYDVVVTPTEDRAHTIFSEVLDGSGYARGTLALRAERRHPVRKRRPMCHTQRWRSVRCWQQ